MTWAEFKRRVNSAVCDDEELAYIDWPGGDIQVRCKGGSDEVVIEGAVCGGDRLPPKEERDNR